MRPRYSSSSSGARNRASLPRMPSGPKRGKGWDRLSDETLRNFPLDRNEDIRFSVESELSRRRKYVTIVITEPAQRSLA